MFFADDMGAYECSGRVYLQSSAAVYFAGILTWLFTCLLTYFKLL